MSFRLVWSHLVRREKFNVDGPDGFAYYWPDLRKEKRIFSKRQNGVDSFMVWGAFAGEKNRGLVFLQGRQPAENYIDTLENYLLPFIDEWMPEGLVFVQNGLVFIELIGLYNFK